MLRRSIIAVSISALAAMSSQVFAGAADVTTQQGDSIKFEYDGPDRIRIQPQAQQGGYMLITGGNMYAVSQQQGQTMVMDLGSSMRMFGQGLGFDAPDPATGELISFEKVDDNLPTTFAGIDGEAYKVTFRNAEGDVETSRLVLADNDLAREFRDVMFGMSRAMLHILDDKADYEKVGEEFYNLLEGRDLGVISWGEEMSLSAISGRQIDPSRFVLPAEPMDMSNLGGIMSQITKAQEEQRAQQQQQQPQQQQQQGGLLGGIMSALGGGQPTEGQDMTGEDNTVSGPREEEEGEESPMKEIGKAFGKLFGGN